MPATPAPTEAIYKFLSRLGSLEITRALYYGERDERAAGNGLAYVRELRNDEARNDVPARALARTRQLIMRPSLTRALSGPKLSGGRCRMITAAMAERHRGHGAMRENKI